MLMNKKFWIVTIKVQVSLAQSVAEALSETALAATVIAPPRQPFAHIEWLYDQSPSIPALTAQLAVIAMVYGIKAPALQVKEVPKLDWLKKVAEDFPPLPIARWTIHGAQHRQKVSDRRHALQIDATNAFGTGEHPTTRGCLIALDHLLKCHKDMRHMLDMGCGSGILAMAFAKATHKYAVAVDLDPDSVAIARSNCNVNGLQKNICYGLSRGYINPIIRRKAPYDLIMSNIFAGPLAHMAKDLKRHLRPGGMVILAGLLNSQANLVLNAHRAQGIHLVKRIISGEWSILVLQRTKRA